MQLNYKEFGQGEPLIILHGLFGTLDNWVTLGKKLAEHFSVFLIDQRNHGRSPHTDVHDYPSMAEDIREFMEQHWMYEGAYVMGHSMGGKTAMQLALTYPELVKKLVVVDIAPKRYEGNHELIFQALLNLHPETLAERSDAEEKLAMYIPDKGIRQFLMKNLTRRAEGGFEFKMNLPVIYEHYDDILDEIEADQPYGGPALFVKGGNSNYILPEDEPAIKALFPKAEIKTVPNAGHWVHAEQPKALLEVLRKFLLGEKLKI
jgi:pimeloyl-ACP methyl ester carboxylesterase